MAKKPEFRIVMPTTPAPAPAPAPRAPAPGRKPSVPPGRKSVTCYPPHDAWLQLRMLAGREGRTIQDLMLEGVDLVFADRRLSQIARSGGE